MNLKNINTPAQLEKHITTLRKRIRTLRKKGNRIELENAIIDLEIALETRNGFAEMRAVLSNMKRSIGR